MPKSGPGAPAKSSTAIAVTGTASGSTERAGDTLQVDMTTAYAQERPQGVDLLCDHNSIRSSQAARQPRACDTRTGHHLVVIRSTPPRRRVAAQRAGACR